MHWNCGEFCLSGRNFFFFGSQWFGLFNYFTNCWHVQSSLGPSGLISEPTEPYLPNQPDLATKTQQLSLEDSEAIQ